MAKASREEVRRGVIESGSEASGAGASMITVVLAAKGAAYAIDGHRGVGKTN